MLAKFRSASSDEVFTSFSIGRRIDLVRERVADDHDARAAVREHERVVARLKERVDRNRDDARFDRAEEHRRKIDRVLHHEHHALLALHAERAQRVSRAIHALGELDVVNASRVVDVRDVIPATLRDAAIEELDGGVVPSRRSRGAGDH